MAEGSRVGPAHRSPDVDVTLQYFDDCPSWQTTDRRLRRLSDEFGFRLHHQRVETSDAARQLAFCGSPTVLIDGDDPFASGDERIGLACRIYDTPDGLAGSPSLDQLRAAIGEDDPTDPAEPRADLD